MDEKRQPVLVTGAGGFIGSHLTEALLAAGRTVVGLDRRGPDDDSAVARNLADATANRAFTFVRADLATAPLDEIVRQCSTVFHLAAVPGVRTSWGDRFADYTASNILATQRLLAACDLGGVRRLVYASSSSVYGHTSRPSRETDLPRPLSPYGVTKLAAEQLCLAYARRPAARMSVVALRYFTVYGPRQRPDMAFTRMLDAAFSGAPFGLYGDAGKRREFTYVGDVVAATVAAATAGTGPTAVVNVGGGASVTLAEAFDVVSRVAGQRVPVVDLPDCSGEAFNTSADLTLARSLLGYTPQTDLLAGLTRQADAMRDWACLAPRRP